jgi:hypothetical protein
LSPSENDLDATVAAGVEWNGDTSRETSTSDAGAVPEAGET